MDTYQPNYKFIDDIKISKIILAGEISNVTLFGSVASEDKTEYLPRDFICNFQLLTDILLHVGSSADQIIEKLTGILAAEFIESPSVVNVVDLLGHELSIQELVLKVCTSKLESENEEWIEDPSDKTYFIDSIIPKSDFTIKEQKREKQLSEYNDMQADNFILLNNAFNYYMRLTRSGVVEKKARKMSGLSHELFLRIAFLNSKMINLSK